MIGQTAAIETYFDKKTADLADTITDFSSQGCLFPEIADDFSVKQEKMPSPTDTVSGFTIILDQDSYSKEKMPSPTDTGSEHVPVLDIFPNQIPRLQEPRYSFAVLQEWEGYVLSISHDTFTARLVDVTKNCTIEEEDADFPLDDLEDDDRTRIRPGSIFRWIIGYRRSPGGTKDRASRIVLRNLPTWTKMELEKNHQDAVVWASKLHGE